MKTSRSDPEPAAQPPLDYWRLFQDLPEAYILFEATAPDYRIVELNKARERLLGIKRKDAIGKPLFSVHRPPGHPYQGQPSERSEALIKKVLRTKRPQQLDPLRYDTTNADGSMVSRYWQSVYIPLRFGGTTITHILAVTKEITQAQLIASRMRRTEQRLEAALAIGKVGSWVWDVTHDKVVTDANVAKLFGVDSRSAAKGTDRLDFVGIIHPADRKRVLQAFMYSIRHHTPFDEEYRLGRKNGRVRWVLARGKVEVVGDTTLFTGVTVDITERRDLQAQVELARQQDKLNRRTAQLLQERNEELEAIARSKDEFVALASHQLRTPATAVKQYVGMVLEGYVGGITPLQTEMLAKAMESNERQIQIINQILNAARVDTGRLVMTPMPLDLGALLRGIAEDMRSSFEQSGHTFQLRLPRQPLRVTADGGYLRMAVENLLNNARVYTPQGGHIDVSLRRVGKECRLSITDDGVGIRKADLDKLFTKFSRIPNPLSVQAGGSGIGLYLTAEIVRLHGGRVSVESKVGKGSTFAISLPLVQK